MMYTILLLSSCIVFCLGRPEYAALIPNGSKVPDPCAGSTDIWQGVGHQNKSGGGTLNPFGEDFQAAGIKWTTELCGKDSDGDGKTNGEELGDPDCKWAQGQPAPSNPATGHPGVCEPMTDAKCTNKNPGIICNSFLI